MNLHLQELVPVAAALNAAKLSGLVAAMIERPGTRQELAERCGLDPRACRHILEVLISFGIVTCEGERIAPSQEIAGAGGYSSSMEDFSARLWQHALEFLRTGEPLITMDGAHSERETLYRDVVPELARMFEGAAEQLASVLSFEPATILEVGCGAGVWSLALARKLPRTRVTGLDLPNVLPNFTARAKKLEMGERVETIAGDMHSVAIPDAKWQLVLIANVLRLEPPEQARALLKRLAAAVRPGGHLLIVDALATGTPEADRARAVYGLHLALRTRTAVVHSIATLKSWMQELGLDDVQALPLTDPRTAASALGALVARRPQ